MKKINKEFWLILIICLLPFILSYSLFYFWKPVRFTNHGDLIDPIIKLKDQSLTINNQFSELVKNHYGNWLVITFLTNSLCDEKCEKKIYWIKQIHTAQGKEMSRLKRILNKNELTEQNNNDQYSIHGLSSEDNYSGNLSIVSSNSSNNQNYSTFNYTQDLITIK